MLCSVSECGCTPICVKGDPKQIHITALLMIGIAALLMIAIAALSVIVLQPNW